MNEKMSRVDAQVIAQSIAQQLATVFGVESIPTVEKLEPMSLDQLTFLKSPPPAGTRVSSTFVVDGVPLVFLSIPNPGGVFDGMLFTLDYGYQVFPSDPNNAVSIGGDDDLDEWVTAILGSHNGEILTPGKLSGWMRANCNLNNAPVPPYIEREVPE